MRSAMPGWAELTAEQQSWIVDIESDGYWRGFNAPDAATEAAPGLERGLDAPTTDAAEIERLRTQVERLESALAESEIGADLATRYLLDCVTEDADSPRCICRGVANGKPYRTSLGEALATIDRVEAMVRLLGPAEMTPTARRQLRAALTLPDEKP